MCFIFRFRELKKQHERQRLSRPADMEAGAVEENISLELSEDSKAASFDVGETEKEDSERSRGTDEMSHKHRSKRESRRMRELEQAQFSLELKKVRTTTVGGPLPDDSTQDGHRRSPQGSPTSHGSFELLSVEDMETEGSGGFGSQSTAPQEQPQVFDIHLQEGLRDANYNEKTMIEAPRATFFIASDQSPAHEPKSPRRASTSRRPVVVLISMQKESPVEERELLAAQTLERHAGAASTSPLTAPKAGLEVGAEMEQPQVVSKQAKRDAYGVDKTSKGSPSVTHGSTPEVSGICSSEVDIQIRLEPKPAANPRLQDRKEVQPAQAAPSPVLDTKPPKAQKKSSAQTVIVNMVEKPSSTVFSPPRRKLPFSK